MTLSSKHTPEPGGPEVLSLPQAGGSEYIPCKAKDCAFNGRWAPEPENYWTLAVPKEDTTFQLFMEKKNPFSVFVVLVTETGHLALALLKEKPDPCMDTKPVKCWNFK